MTKTTIALVLSLTSLTLSGCMSASIISSGKNYERVARPGSHVTQAREALGLPSWREQYSPSIPINQTGPFRAHAERDLPFEPFVWDGKCVGRTNLTALCEVYTRQGPYAEMVRGQEFGMISGLTFGIGDLVCLPAAIRQRRQMSKRFYSLTIWYDANGDFVGYFKGDIRDTDRVSWWIGRETPSPAVPQRGAPALSPISKRPGSG